MNSSVQQERDGTVRTCALLLLAALVLAGCRTGAEAMSRVSLGMTKTQVIATMGSPKSISATGHTEVMHYRLSEYPVGAGRYDRPLSEYVVILRDGRVEAYGRQGEFVEPRGSYARPRVEVYNQIEINNSR